MVTGLLRKIFGSRNDRLLKQYQREVMAINALEPAMQALSDDALRAKTAEFKQRVAAGTSLDELLPEAFAVVREAGVRALGMRHLMCNWSVAWPCTKARSPRCAPARARP